MSNQEERIVLILVGLVGSGKSTFATALVHHFPHQWRRCNQDELGSRIQVESLARDSLRAGFSVCIDRTNIDERQRAHWVRIANEFSGTSIWVIVFSTPYEVCASRLQNRTSHPTIQSVEQGLSVLSRFSKDFRPPATDEGFDRIVSLSPADTAPQYSSLEISQILEHVRTSPAISRPAPTRVSWAERRRQMRSDGRYTYGHEGQNRGGGHSSRAGFFSRSWEQGTSTFSTSQDQHLNVDAKATRDIKISGSNTGRVNEEESINHSSELLDSLGVD